MPIKPSGRWKTNQLIQTIRSFAARAITLGDLSWLSLAKQLWHRLQKNDVLGRSAQLSFYFLLAIFPLLIFVSALLGRVFATREDLYPNLLFYLQTVMPPSAFDLLSGTLKEIRQETASGKLTAGLIASVWIASSGMEAIIAGLNVAYGVTETRPWWKSRLVAIALTACLGLLIVVALFLILAGSALSAGIGTYFPIVEKVGRLSTVTQWVIGAFFLLTALALIFRFAPNLRQRRIEGNVPGAVLSFICWLASSAGLRVYLVAFGSFHETYGPLGAVVVLLVWLYVSGAAILVGGEFNSIIWQAVVRNRDGQPATD